MPTFELKNRIRSVFSRYKEQSYSRLDTAKEETSCVDTSSANAKDTYGSLDVTPRESVSASNSKSAKPLHDVKRWGINTHYFIILNLYIWHWPFLGLTYRIFYTFLYKKKKIIYRRSNKEHIDNDLLLRIISWDNSRQSSLNNRLELKYCTCWIFLFFLSILKCYHNVPWNRLYTLYVYM